MSRRRVSADEPGYTWEYGWDPQRQTFHAQLLAADEQSPPLRGLARFGNRVREIGSTDALMYLMGMRLSDDRVAVLEHDRLTDSEEVEVRFRARPGPRRSVLAASGTRRARPEHTFPRRTLISG